MIKNLLLTPRSLIIGLIAMYALVPYFLHFLNIYEVPWAGMNLIFSLVLIIQMTLLKSNSRNFITLKFKPPKRKSLLLYFVLSAVVFYQFPWHSDRVSFGASVSAIFRAIWLYVMLSHLYCSERRRLFIFILTTILMFIDESRTYFLIGFLALGFYSKKKSTYILLGIGAAILLAATRMNVKADSLNFFLYGIIGESYNATKPVGQVMQLSNVNINEFGHLFHTFFQPFLIPIELVLNKLFNISSINQSTYLGAAVKNQLGETLSPMGGWYITADFVYYGYFFGIIFLLIYNWIGWKLTHYLFNPKIAPFLFFIFIKATPFVYWKFIIYVIIVFSCLGFFQKLKLGRR